jgi:hypothetical protein
MRRVALMVLLSIAVATGADKDKDHFAPKAASSYPGHQTISGITIAAVPYTREDEVKAAFGKANPYKYGILPVLVVIQNDTGKALRLNLKAELVDLLENRANAMKPGDVRLVDGARNKDWRLPGPSISPIPLPHHKGGPLDTWEIDGHAFNAKLDPPGDVVFGFFYFDETLRAGAHLYLTGLADAASGKDYFSFEVPFEDQKP